MGIYIGYFASKKTQSLNRVDLVNELFIQIQCIHVVLFTDFVGDPELQYNCAYSAIGFFSLTMIYNLLYVLYYGFRRIGLQIIYVRLLIKSKITSKMEQQIEESSSSEEVI